MKEISLNILDIAMNSVRADSQNISVFIDETQETIAFSVIDDGCGMSKDLLNKVSDPFCTTRTTRRVGMGIPFLKLTAEQTGGYIEINSKSKDEFPNNHGTRISALFYKNHIDCLPLGDIISTVITLIQGAPQIDFEFKHRFDYEKEIVLSTKEIKNILGGVSVDTPDVLVWIRDFLTEQYDQCKKKLIIKKRKGKAMKSLAELAAIREKMQDKVLIRENRGTFRIVVGMATCGIAAGARPVLNTFVEGIVKEGLTEKVTVVQTGCIGLCQYEPVVEVFNGDEKVTYVNVTPEKAQHIIEEHIKNGKIVKEYTISAETK